MELWDEVPSFKEGIGVPIAKELSEDGELFSGGKLQRPSLARTLTKDANKLGFAR